MTDHDLRQPVQHLRRRSLFRVIGVVLATSLAVGAALVATTGLAAASGSSTSTRSTSKDPDGGAWSDLTRAQWPSLASGAPWASLASGAPWAIPASGAPWGARAGTGWPSGGPGGPAGGWAWGGPAGWADAPSDESLDGGSSSTEYFHVVSTNPRGPGAIIITGAVNAGGTERPGRATDSATFSDGTFHIDHSSGQPIVRFDPAACVGTITQTGPFRVYDGTGRLSSLKGSGTYRFTALYTTAPAAHGCSKTMTAYLETIRGAITLTH